MPREIVGAPGGAGLRIGLVVARFNAFVTEGLLAGALAALREADVADGDVTIVRVPGAFEVPLAARALADSGKVDGIVCLGAVIRGDTPHFDFVAGAATDGLRTMMLERGLPIGFGILTTDTVEQALERSAEGEGNKGAEAARTVIEMASLLAALRGSRA
jgi:6,7-dimethyl-8-ribityllumazine synthase